MNNDIWLIKCGKKFFSMVKHIHNESAHLNKIYDVDFDNMTGKTLFEGSWEVINPQVSLLLAGLFSHSNNPLWSPNRVDVR